MANMRTIKIKSGSTELLFSPDGGGFPTEIRIREFGGKITAVMNNPHPMLSMKCGQTLLEPKLSAACHPRKYRRGGAQILEFPRLAWHNPHSGSVQDDLYLALKWEFFPDGPVFCEIFLYYSSLDVPAIKDFKLAIPLDFSSVDDVKWAICKFPREVDGAIIQTDMGERFLGQDESKCFEDGLFASANFNAMRKNCPSWFAEFFLEGNNSLFNNNFRHTASAVNMNSDIGQLEWNFQSVSATGNSRPLHWRNRWGFLLKPAIQTRHQPPLPMCHYLDNFQRLPSNEQLREIAASGAKLLILHDCWRLDTQNGGIPYDVIRLKELVEQVRALNMRLALYIRGNEQSVRETAADWFDNWLRKNIDGLYMDYAGPIGFFAAPNENFPGGRILFREYYCCMGKLRRRVGKNGLLLAHTGPGYSGIAMQFFDTYVSGEGERGILVKGRREHEYFSMSAVACGSMWTAAFPEYGSPLMTPFLAATGQAPHLPLGIQIMSSSLAHPPVPGINDLAFRELLYCWSLLGNGFDFDFYTDYNSSGVFNPADAQESGHCIILSPDKKSGVMFIANLANHSAQASFKFNKEAIGRKNISYRLYQIPGQHDPATVTQLGPYQFAAALIACDQQQASRIIRQYPHANHAPGKIAQEYLKEVELQKEYRSASPPCHECKLRVSLPSRMTSHEQSLWDDLYNIEIALRAVMPDGSVRQLGWISKNGLEKNLPKSTSRLKPGNISNPIDLKELLGPGRYELQLYSQQAGESFYSFVTAELTADEKNIKTIQFTNQLENDRAVLRWKLELR